MANPPASRRAFLFAGASLIASLFFALWSWQQIDRELSRPSPVLLLMITVGCLIAAAVAFGWAIGWKRGAKGRV